MHRFVLLHHQFPEDHPRESHWDLMIESEAGVLLTWALPQMLTASAAQEMEVAKLEDHRLEYLTIEGTLSGDRGAVSRVEAGTFLPITIDPQLVEVDLEGEILQGRVTLKQIHEERFELQFDPR